MGDGEMMMDIVEAVTGNRTVPQIFICGQLVPGGGSGLKHLPQLVSSMRFLLSAVMEISAARNLTNTVSTDKPLLHHLLLYIPTVRNLITLLLILYIAYLYVNILLNAE